MTHCAKCGAELIGSRKFCAACGTPAGDPRSPAASTGQAPVASGRAPGAAGRLGPWQRPGNPVRAGTDLEGQPVRADRRPRHEEPTRVRLRAAARVNPGRARDHGTPGMGDPSAAPQVSPLAVSNVISQRGAFENAIDRRTGSSGCRGGRTVSRWPAAPARPTPRRQQAQRRSRHAVMPSIANPPTSPGARPGSAPASATAGPAVSKRQDRTQLLGAIPAGFDPAPGAPLLLRSPRPASARSRPAVPPQRASRRAAAAAAAAGAAAAAATAATQPARGPARPLRPARPPPQMPYAGGAYAPQQPCPHATQPPLQPPQPPRLRPLPPATASATSRARASP